ncbi:MAG: PAS domain S-box protein, partial [Deltaproteobacteria bacterium]|nr:PAS domain S-box protein [Deltaproteobacteria bacterium]
MQDQAHVERRGEGLRQLEQERRVAALLVQLGDRARDLEVGVGAGHEHGVGGVEPDEVIEAVGERPPGGSGVGLVADDAHQSLHGFVTLPPQRAGDGLVAAAEVGVGQHEVWPESLCEFEQLVDVAGLDGVPAVGPQRLGEAAATTHVAQRDDPHRTLVFRTLRPGPHLRRGLFLLEGGDLVFAVLDHGTGLVARVVPGFVGRVLRKAAVSRRALKGRQVVVIARHKWRSSGIVVFWRRAPGSRDTRRGRSANLLRGQRGSTIRSVAAPFVLLVVDDTIDPLLRAALRARDPAPAVVRAAPDEIGEVVRRARVDVVVIGPHLTGASSLALVAELTALPAAPHVVALFAEPTDVRRVECARAGVWEHVLPTAGTDAFAPCAALIDRLLRNDARGAALSAQARQFQALVEASSDGVYILNEGRFSWVNRRFQEMVGFSAHELTAPGFSMLDEITAPESRALILERGRRVAAGEVLEPHYEFVARRRDGTTFDAHVSIAYLELDDGNAGALGIMQDITERKRFEKVLVRKNRELQLLNGLTATVTAAGDVDTTLQLACRHVLSMLDVDAAGVSLLRPDQRTLTLRASERLPHYIAEALADVPVDSSSLLARAFHSGVVEVIPDVRSDPRVTVEPLRTSDFGAAVVVPLRGRNERRVAGSHRVIGVAFALLPRGRSQSESDND